ncbi:SGNH/GDSL hydrolase family protein [Gordonia polyisoprenivorans]|uniref:SGNH/GDSL hydrolase family protein n=1 Tax=Gordonia polyisoprenivorans TaxID=84595 RepID=UPI002300873C|nr:SGNH/GDSL hydrolase family protein [Gordonia polyisoprenivorans]WCB35553.1 SGNH/GDSL hydrolase family protein [Gordonia polyisoprenivorans]
MPAAFRTQNPVATGAVVILSTLVLSALSWRYVEDPIRRHGFGKAFTTPRDPEDTLMNHLLAWLITTTTRFADWLTRLQARRETALSASNSGSPMAPTETPPPESPARESPARRASTADGDVTPEVANTAAPTPIEVEVATDLTATDLDVTDETTATDPTDVALPIYVEAALEHSRPPEPLTTEPAIPTITIPAVAVPTDGASVAATTTHPWRRRSNLVTSIVAVVALAVTGLLGLTALRSSDPQTLDTASLSEELPTTTSTGVPTGPTLPVTLRKTRCSTVIHIGDSTSIGMNDPDTLPDPATRIIGRYRQVGAQNVITDIVGARSSLETVNGQPNAVTAINGHLARGERGCWVMAMGINDTANIEVGGPGPDDMRIDRLLGPLRNQPVMWPTVITSPLNQNPAYANDAMQRFDRALLRACKRYPNLRLYNWAAEARPDWFSDGIHYTAAGYTQRAYRFAIALASVFPARDAPPKGCLLQTSGVVGVPPSPTPSPGPTSTAPRQG